MKENGMLRKGDFGKEVKELQKRLRKEGYHVTVDGVFGDHTARAVRGYQRKNGLTADGIVGDNTWDALAGVKRKEKTSGSQQETRGEEKQRGYSSPSSNIAAQKAKPAAERNDRAGLGEESGDSLDREIARVVDKNYREAEKRWGKIGEGMNHFEGRYGKHKIPEGVIPELYEMAYRSLEREEREDERKKKSASRKEGIGYNGNKWDNWNYARGKGEELEETSPYLFADPNEGKTGGWATKKGMGNGPAFLETREDVLEMQQALGVSETGEWDEETERVYRERMKGLGGLLYQDQPEIAGLPFDKDGLEKNGCSTTATNNVLQLMGINVPYEEIYAWHRETEDENFSGTIPWRTEEYIARQMPEVSIRNAAWEYPLITPETEDTLPLEARAQAVIEEDGYGILCYMYSTSAGIGAHYVAVEKDEEEGIQVYDYGFKDGKRTAGPRYYPTVHDFINDKKDRMLISAWGLSKRERE